MLHIPNKNDKKHELVKNENNDLNSFFIFYFFLETNKRKGIDSTID